MARAGKKGRQKNHKNLIAQKLTVWAVNARTEPAGAGHRSHGAQDKH